MSSKKINAPVELTSDDRIIYQGLINNPDLPVEQLAKKISSSDPDETSTVNSWSHKIRRFKQKYPGWKNENFIIKSITELSGEYGLENRQLKNRVRQLQVEVDTITKEANRQLTHYQKLADVIPALPIVKDVPIIGQRHSKIREEDCVLELSDAHINRVIHKEQMNGLNEYNFDIFANRYWFLLSEVIKIVNAQRYDKTMSVLYVDCLGDMFNDIHREENIRNNQFDPVPSVILGAYVLAQGLMILAPHFKKIVFTGIVGNEPRWDKEKPSKGKYNNMDYDAYHFMSLALRDYVDSGKIEFNIPVSPEIIITRMGKRFLLQHGDSIKSSLGFPAYGVNRDWEKLQALYRSVGGMDYMELGHFHQEYALKSQILMNGSICGTDEYAKNTLHVTGKPTQKLFGINAKYGVSWIYDIQLQNATENGFVYDLKHLNSKGIGASWNDFLKKKPTFSVENTLVEVDVFQANKQKRMKK